MNDSNNETLKAAKAKAEHYCASRECCRFDLERKFRQWDVPEELWEEVIDHLKEYDFLNEKRYIRTFVESKFKHNQWGRIKIKHALRQKHLPEELIEEELNRLDETQYRNTLKTLVHKKAGGVKGRNNYEKRQKITNSMASKGYEPALVMEILDEENIFKI